MDGYVENSSRFILRKDWELNGNRPPGFSPLFHMDLVLVFLPQVIQNYEVEMIDGVFPHLGKKKIFNIHRIF
jgi:hypothetical protein